MVIELPEPTITWDEKDAFDKGTSVQPQEPRRLNPLLYVLSHPAHGPSPDATGVVNANPVELNEAARLLH